MIPSEEFSANDTRESVLQKVGEFVDRMVDENMAASVAAIQKADFMEPEDMWEWIENARRWAVEDRARVLQDVAKMLDRNNLCLRGR
jgi:hypothetical protein